MMKTLVGDTGGKVREFFDLVKQYVDANVWKLGPCTYEIEAEGGELDVTQMRECTIVTGPYQLRVDVLTSTVYIEDVRTYNRIARLTITEVVSCGYRKGKVRLVLKVRE